MAVSMTYTTLFADLQAYIERGAAADTRVYAQIPSLINLAERDIADKLKILGFLVVDTAASTAAGTAVYSKPTRWRKTAQLSLISGSSRYQLRPRSFEFCQRLRYEASQRTPEFYADHDYDEWVFAPTPDATYTIERVYWQLPQLLDGSNTTNWLTDYAPNALLAGALLQCSLFLKHTEFIGIHQQMYDAQLAALDGSDIQRVLDRTSVRSEV